MLSRRQFYGAGILAPAAQSRMPRPPRIVVVARAGPGNPRNDTASVVELPTGELLLAWHKFGAGDNRMPGGDFAPSRIFCKTSRDGGLTWEDERMLVDLAPGDINVQAPAFRLLPSGELLFICLRAHARNSTSMLLFRSRDSGQTFEGPQKIWERSQGQWLQGGATGLYLLASGRLLLPFMWGTGDQFSQHISVRFFLSDDGGRGWRMASGSIDLPMRGAMEPSVAELDGGGLLLSLRTQLGSVFLSRSVDGGETWSLAQTSGLKAPESCTCLRRIPGTRRLVLFWNDSVYNPKHHHYGERSPLSAAVSDDDGNAWRRIGNIAEGPKEFTNLGCTFLRSGRAVVTYMVDDPPFARRSIDLCAAVIEREWFLRA